MTKKKVTLSIGNSARFNNAIECVVVKNTTMFKVKDISHVSDYSISGINYHLRGTKHFKKIEDEQLIDVKGLNFLSKKATRQTLIKEIYIWAKLFVSKKEEIIQPVAVKLPMINIPPVMNIIPDVYMEYGIAEAAKITGMKIREFTSFLIEEGFANRYTSNNNVFWQSWFKKSGYGVLATIADNHGTRSSNVPRLTASGLEYIKNRISSKVESGVLAFAYKESAVEEKNLEKEIDDVIDLVFKTKLVKKNHFYNSIFSEDANEEYNMTKSELRAGVRSILAAIKLKELK